MTLSERVVAPGLIGVTGVAGSMKRANRRSGGRWRSLLGLAMLASVCVVGGCAASTPKPKQDVTDGNRRSKGFTVDDQSRCDWKGHKDREVSEVTAVAALQPNVRRVYQLVGHGADRRRVLICREVDTNYDGVKDVVRLYSDKGELQREEADTNYDGHVDSWAVYANGHLVKYESDRNGDRKADVWKYYSGGKIARAQRDTNFDGNADVWEIYVQGKLDRIGVDLDNDGRVDRWDRDESARVATKTQKTSEDSKAVEGGNGDDDEEDGDQPARGKSSGQSSPSSK